MKLYNADCLEVLKTLESKSVDLVVTDPPFDFESRGGGFLHKNNSAYKQIRESKIDNGFDFAILDELCRVMKKINIYLWCNKKQIPQYLDYFKGVPFTLISWHKTNPVPAINGHYLADTEYCLFFKEGGVMLYGNFDTLKTYYFTPTNKADKEKYKHPTIKPLEIIENLVFNSSKEGGLVLDCFMGSGTTGVACKRLNRDFIGMEINPEFFEIAENRINGTKSKEIQECLF